MSNERVNKLQPTVDSRLSLYKEPESDECKRCGKYIYPLELIGPVMGFRYHKQCFRCVVCDSQIDFKSFRTNLIDINDRSVYCSSHYPRNGKHTDSLSGRGSLSRSSELLNVATYMDSTLNKTAKKSNDSLSEVSSVEKMLNMRDYSSHSIHESTHSTEKLEEHTSEHKRLVSKSNTEEIVGTQRKVKIEESSHSSSFENHSISTSSFDAHALPFRQAQNGQIKSDLVVRPITEAFEATEFASLRDIDDFYDTSSKSASMINKKSTSSDSSLSKDTHTGTHTHLYEIMKEARAKETLYNQSYSQTQTDLTDSHSNLKTIMSEIQAHNLKSKSANSTKSASTSSFSSEQTRVMQIFKLIS